MPDITNQQLLTAITDTIQGVVRTTVEQAVEQTVQQSVEQAVGQAVHRSVEEVVERAVQASEQRIRHDMAAKSDLEALAMTTKADIQALGDRLERKIASNHTASIRHHLETRNSIGDLNRQFGAFREGLARAAAPQ